jgi:hypothetical protein
MHACTLPLHFQVAISACFLFELAVRLQTFGLSYFSSWFNVSAADACYYALKLMPLLLMYGYYAGTAARLLYFNCEHDGAQRRDCIAS